MTSRIYNMIVAVDIGLFGVLSCGSARRGETASGAAYRLEQAGKWQGRFFRPLIDKIMRRWEPDHCYASWLIENKPLLWNASNCALYP